MHEGAQEVRVELRCELRQDSLLRVGVWVADSVAAEVVPEYAEEGC